MTAGPASCSTVELQSLPLRFADDALAVPHQLAVDPGRSDARMEGGTLERRPRALRKHVLAAHGERCVVHERQVRTVALAQNASLLHVDNMSRRARDLLTQLRLTQPTPPHPIHLLPPHGIPPTQPTRRAD